METQCAGFGQRRNAAFAQIRLCDRGGGLGPGRVFKTRKTRKTRKLYKSRGDAAMTPSLSQAMDCRRRDAKGDRGALDGHELAFNGTTFGTKHGIPAARPRR
jgi:hypothetical protein